ncbi:Ecotin precursor [Campylobacter concisus UNSW1]|uniref:ecotin precursor n=1 Tax=Campylobacter concisus TaxID=199 RepID=UPI000398CD99|nr:ecotin precursor [Campylobacter concisus]ERJ23117.1 Ecotin precursor [Campylobacter concisus UNSW1]
MKQILSLIVFLLPVMLLASEASDKSEAKMQEQVFELPISKMPHDYFKYEVAFFKEVQTDCEFAMLEGGRLDKKEDKSGIYYEFSADDEPLKPCNGKKKKRQIYYEFTQILPAISPIKIVTPQVVGAEIRIYERVETIKPKILKRKEK